MKEAYRDINFQRTSLNLILQIDSIIEEYQAQGYVLTVRQLYYQLVARDIIPNTERSYKNTTSLVNDARLAGLLDWDAIEDRTRAFDTPNRWESGGDLLNACAKQFHMDMWDNQRNRLFVIVEKEALAGVLERTCRKYDVPLLAARGYPSVSVLREFAQDICHYGSTLSQNVVILHLGDHDPSGIDMSRDLEMRLTMLTRYEPFEFHRIALNMDRGGRPAAQSGQGDRQSVCGLLVEVWERKLGAGCTVAAVSQQLDC